MSTSMKALLAGAALAGLMTGASAKLNAQTLGQNNAGIRAVSMQDDGSTSKKDRKTKRKSTLVRAKTPAKARVAARPVTMVARERTPARARVAVQRTGPKCPLMHPSRTRTKDTSTPMGRG